MRKIILVLTGLALAVTPLLSADNTSTVSADGRERGRFQPQLPNPAAQLCQELGGISVTADENIWGGAQLGLCRLEDDSLIDDWTLSRATSGELDMALAAFQLSSWQPQSGPIENWAIEACVAAGGAVVEYAEHLRPDSIVRLCEFSDGSLIEAWTLFAGPQIYSELARATGLAARPGPFFIHCPWPHTCMAPCNLDSPPQVLCRTLNGALYATSFACCCCGSGVNSYVRLTRHPGITTGP